jgi:hypothetical protein
MTPILLISLSLCLSSAKTPEERALAFLAVEVPRWSAENQCYSCHNNGDAARALYRAQRGTHAVPAKSLEDTTRWLARPEGWDKNGGDSSPKDQGLARVQFAAALLEAGAAGQLTDRAPLLRAAALVAEHQKKEGCWKPDGEETVGSPATYGTALTTYQARRVLQQADPERYRAEIARADRWLRDLKVERVLDAAAVLLALEGSEDEAAQQQRRRCLELIRKGEAKGGGWGPFVTSGPEVFDTAVVLLALIALRDKDAPAMIKRGRAYLLAMQHKDGSWPETTRPAGGGSYAQRISTSGWATLALLATRGQ